MPDRMQFAANVQKIDDRLVIPLPKHVIEKLNLKENDGVVFEIRRYMTAMLPKR